MKLPRGVSADRVIRALERLGYEVIRQKGGHVRLRHEGPPVHAITVPLQQPAQDRHASRHSFRNSKGEVAHHRIHH